MATSKKGKTAGPFEALRALKDELATKEGQATQKRQAQKPPPKRTTEAQPEDESLLFHRLFAGVRPLDKAPARVSKERLERSPSAERAAKRGREAAQAEDDAVKDRLRELVEGGARFEVADDGRRVEGRRLDLSLDALRRLRRGRLPIDARLDLHGMSIREARGQLELFLRTMRARGERCVLIVHGKGEHSPQGVGLLRGEIAAWLSQGPSSQQVAGFTTAAEHDGGEGAVYVLLRR